jgi:K+-sensing histidine kinase KdpD
MPRAFERAWVDQRAVRRIDRCASARVHTHRAWCGRRGAWRTGAVFLTAVLFSAVAWGLGPSIFASILSVLAYDFFFVPPVYTLC